MGARVVLPHGLRAPVAGLIDCRLRLPQGADSTGAGNRPALVDGDAEDFIGIPGLLTPAPTADPRDVVDAIARLNALEGVTIEPGQRLAIPSEYADAG